MLRSNQYGYFVKVKVNATKLKLEMTELCYFNHSLKGASAVSAR